ncbi:MAG: plasmid mobilization relaxosome protein MobC, partial [Specibacter sp.]
MALFSRKKTAPSPTVSPWVLAGEAVKAKREAEAADAAAARPVFEPRKAGRPTVENPRTRRVSMSLTEEEHAALSAAAGDRSVSAWARGEILAKLDTSDSNHISAGVEVAKLRADLGRVGSNLNQLVRAVNSGHAPSSSELLEAVQATREELA